MHSLTKAILTPFSIGQVILILFMICKRISMISQRFWFPTTAIALFTLSSCTKIKAPPEVILIESSSDVLIHWIKTGVRGAVAVNVNAHDDCAPIPSNNIAKLKRYHKTGNLAAIDLATSSPDSVLFGINDVISAACALGIARKAIWVAPTLRAPTLVREHIPFFTCTLDSLPKLRKTPVLINVDADFVPAFAAQQLINLIEAIQRIGEKLRATPWNVVQISVSFSVDGGYIPVRLRWVGNALQEALEGKNLSRPEAPWSLLLKVEDWHGGLPPGEVVRKIRPLVHKRPDDPWLHVYLAEVLYKSGDVSGALTEGLKAMELDSGCCRILPELGRQLADAGRLEEAERFLAAAPAVMNVAAEQALALALDRAGRTVKAIEHLIRIREWQANYSVDLLIGYGYERLRDTTKARRYYRRAVSLLGATVGEMPAFPNTGRIAIAAERFLKTVGDRKEAMTLRRDPRLISFFYNNEN